MKSAAFNNYKLKSKNVTSIMDLLPGINDISDAFTALPKDFIKYFTLLKEIDAKCINTTPQIINLINNYVKIIDQNINSPLISSDALMNVDHNLDLNNDKLDGLNNDKLDGLNNDKLDGLNNDKLDGGNLISDVIGSSGTGVNGVSGTVSGVGDAVSGTVSGVGVGANGENGSPAVSGVSGVFGVSGVSAISGVSGVSGGNDGANNMNSISNGGLGVNTNGIGHSSISGDTSENGVGSVAAHLLSSAADSTSSAPVSGPVVSTDSSLTAISGSAGSAAVSEILNGLGLGTSHLPISVSSNSNLVNSTLVPNSIFSSSKGVTDHSLPNKVLTTSTLSDIPTSKKVDLLNKSYGDEQKFIKEVKDSIIFPKSKHSKTYLENTIRKKLNEIIPCLEEKLQVSRLGSDSVNRSKYRINQDYKLIIHNNEVPESVRIGPLNHPAMIMDPSVSTATSSAVDRTVQAQRSETRRETLAARKNEKRGKESPLDKSPPTSPPPSNYFSNININNPKKRTRDDHLLKKKRIRNDDDVSDDQKSKPNTNPKSGEREQTYCYCNQISFGDMVGCDGEDCKREWFHLTCIGFKNAPKGKWYCEDCLIKMKKKKV